MTPIKQIRMEDLRPGKPKVENNAHRRGYTRQWRKVARAHLARHPLCLNCKRKGRIRAAQCVDHVKPHEGDQALFWDPRNRRSLCNPCHARKDEDKARGMTLPEALEAFDRGELWR